MNVYQTVYINFCRGQDQAFQAAEDWQFKYAVYVFKLLVHDF